MRSLILTLLLVISASAQNIFIVGPKPGDPHIIIEILPPDSAPPVEPEPPPVEPDPPPAARTTYYVAPDGDNGRSCSEAQNISTPKRTITEALSCLSPGQAIDVQEGIYPESFIGNIPAGTSWEQPVIIQGRAGSKPTIKPAAGSEFVFRFVGPQKYIILDNLIIDGSNVRYDAVKITITNGIPAHHIRIKDSTVQNAGTGPCPTAPCGGQGILVGNGSHSNEFLNLLVRNNGRTDFDHGYYFSSTYGNLIEGGIIEDNFGYGGKFDCSGDCAQESDSNILRNAIIRNNSRNGYRGGWVINGGQNNEIDNCIFTGNASGINLTSTRGGNKIRNNTLVSNNASPHSWNKYCMRSVSSSGDEFRNNICWNHASGDINLISGGTINQSDNLLGRDPRFVDAAKGDFRLKTNSPAIDAGAMLPEVKTDKDGTPRPQGKGYDIGAYEQ